MGHLAGEQTRQGGGAVDYEPDKGQVDRLDMAAGWACFLASGTSPKPEDLPLYLSKAVAAWQKQNPMLTVRATLPIVAMGIRLRCMCGLSDRLRLQPRRRPGWIPTAMRT